MRKKNKGYQLLLKVLNPQVMIVVAVWVCTFYLCNQILLANSIESSKFFTGTKKLIEDANNALLVIAPILGGLMCVYCFIMKMASDEMDAKKWTGRIKVAIVCVIIAVGFSAFMTIILSYFK